jgi:tetratricopeptide (TPR) repeat protein
MHAPRLGSGIALLLALLALSVPKPSEAQLARIGGQVKDDEGKPVAGATIVAENPAAAPSELHTTTDRKGRFGMIGLRSGVWTLTVTAPGHEGVQGSVRVSVARSNPPVDFHLRKLAEPVRAVGTWSIQTIEERIQAADTLLERGQADDAIAAYRRLLEQVPRLTTLNLQIGRAYRQKKDYDAAVAAYRIAIDANAAPARARIELGLTALERGDTATAIATLREAAATANAGADAFVALGDAELASGQAEDAVRSFERAAATDPAWSKPLLRLAQVAADRGDRATAREFAERLLDMAPTSDDASDARVLLERLQP